jgi:DNA-binding transcriptional MerR regulator
MINFELGNNYGCDNQDELLATIESLKSMGMSDEEINEILNRSNDKNDNLASE